jgi:hypothetical protein
MAGSCVPEKSGPSQSTQRGCSKGTWPAAEPGWWGAVWPQNSCRNRSKPLCRGTSRGRPHAKRQPPGSRPTLAELQRSHCWTWVYCEKCLHHAPMALVPLIIRWDADTSSDRLRRCARGRRGTPQPFLPRALIWVVVILHSSGIRLTNVGSHPMRK